MTRPAETSAIVYESGPDRPGVVVESATRPRDETVQGIAHPADWRAREFFPLLPGRDSAGHIEGYIDDARIAAAYILRNEGLYVRIRVQR